MRERGVRWVGSLLVVASLGAWVAPAAAQESWGQVQGSGRRVGRASGQGSVVAPAPRWEIELGGAVGDSAILTVDLDGDGPPETLLSVQGALLARQSNDTIRWDLPPLNLSYLSGAFDFDGDGREEVLALGRSLYILDGETGAERWRLDHPVPGQALSNQTALPVDVDGDGQLELLLGHGNGARLALFSFEGGYGAVQTRWVSAEASLPQTVARYVIGDLDGDGQAQEVATVNHTGCQVVVLDLSSGALRRVSAPTVSSGAVCYGQLEVADLDGDGADELIMGSSQGGVNAVFAYSYAQDRVLWRYEYPSAAGQTSLLAPQQLVGDLDGDGTLEVAFSVFNDTQEAANSPDDGVEAPQRWVTLVLDGATGAVLGSAVDAVVAGRFDGDHDGAEELVLSAATPERIGLPLWAGVTLWGLNAERELTLRWSVPRAQPIPQLVRAEVRRTGYTNRSVLGAQEVSEGAGASLLLAQLDLLDPRQARIQAMRFTAGRAPEVLASTGVDAAAVLSVTGGGGESAWIALKDSAGSNLILGRRLELLYGVSVFGTTSPGFAAPRREGFGVVFRGSSGSLTLTEVTEANLLQPPEVVMRRAANGGGLTLAAQLDGEGGAEIVWSGVRADGSYYLEVLDEDGEVVWARVLADASQPLQRLTTGALGAGGAPGLAAIVSVVGVGGVVEVWEGQTGASRRRTTPADVGRYPNQDLLTAGDLDGDGVEELLLLHWTVFEVLSGATLERLGGLRAYPSGFSAPGRSSVLPAGAGAGPALFLNAANGGKALISVLDGALRWSLPALPHWAGQTLSYAGFADANGDGVWEVAVPGTLGDLEVRDGLSGAPLYRRCLRDGVVEELSEVATAASCAENVGLSSIAVADIDGDGAEEWIVGSRDGWLYAIGVENGEARWALELRYAVDSPVVEDLDGDGELEVLVSTAESLLVLVDQAGLPPSDEVREVLIGDDGAVLLPEQDIDAWGRRDALGIAWEPVVGAEGYLYAVLSENDNLVVPWTDVGAATAVVREELSLVVGARYRALVIPYSAALGAGVQQSSDGVLIVEEAPRIENLNASPNPFQPVQGDVTTITATIYAGSGAPLSRVEGHIIDGSGREVYTTAAALQGDRWELAWTWDGREGGAPLLPGQYTLAVLVWDQAGQLAVSQLILEIAAVDIIDAGMEDAAEDAAEDVAEDGAPAEDAAEEVTPDAPEPTPDAAPDDAGFDVSSASGDAYGAEEEGCCTCSTPGRRPSGAAPGALALLLLGLGAGGLRRLQRRRRV